MRSIALLFCVILHIGCNSNSTDEDSISHLIIEQQSQEEVSTNDTLFNNYSYLVIGRSDIEIIISKEGSQGNYPDHEILIGYRDDIILGKGGAFDDVEIYAKYHPTKTFDEFVVDMYEGELAAPDLKGFPDFQNFKTRIREGCENGINFAGHFTIITWGCGSECQSMVLIDRKKGAIYDGVHTSHGSEFIKDSRLLITNKYAVNESMLIRLCSYCVVDELVWDGYSFAQ